MMKFLIKLFTISVILITTNFSQTDSRLNDFFKNTEFKSAEDIINRLKKHENGLFKQDNPEKLQLLKSEAGKTSRLDSLIISSPVLFDTTNAENKYKLIFSYYSDMIGYNIITKVLSGKEWFNQTRETYIYDNTSRITKEIYEEWKNGIWRPIRRTMYTNYIGGRSYSSVYENYNDWFWETERKTEELFNNRGNHLYTKTESWANSKLNYFSVDSSIYDLNDRLIRTSERSVYAPQSEYFRWTYFKYTKAGDIEEVLTRYKYPLYLSDDSSLSRIKYTYYQKNKVKTVEYDKWKNDKWVTTTKDIYQFYTDNKIQSCITQILKGDSLVTKFREYQEFDDKGNITFAKYENFESEEADVFQNTYNSQNKRLTNLWIRYKNDKVEWIYKSEDKYHLTGLKIYSYDEYFMDETWKPLSKFFAECDESGNLINAIAERWQGKWIPNTETFTYPGPDSRNRWSIVYHKLTAYYSNTAPYENSAVPYTELMQNYPNPFNNQTRINFYLKNDSNVKLEIFDVLGKKIKELINTTLEKGLQGVDFNSSGLASGIYFYRLITDGYTGTKKMMILK